MTVVVSAFIPSSGFMFAADGRSHTGDGRWLCDYTQKIHPVSHLNGSFMFAWAGATTLQTPFGGDFSFADKTLAFFQDMQDESFASWSELVNALGARIQASLLFSVKSRRVYTDNIPPSEVIAATEIVGYFKQTPVHAVLMIVHRDGILRDPVIKELRELDKEHRREICNLTQEPFFEEAVKECPNSLEEAVETAKKYIHICSERDAKYGGRTHVAFCTKDGFQWESAPSKS